MAVKTIWPRFVLSGALLASGLGSACWSFELAADRDAVDEALLEELGVTTDPVAETKADPTAKPMPAELVPDEEGQPEGTEAAPSTPPVKAAPKRTDEEAPTEIAPDEMPAKAAPKRIDEEMSIKRLPVEAKPALNPKSSEAESGEPQSTEPQSTEPQATEPESTEPKLTEPKRLEPTTVEPKTLEPKATEPKVSEPAVNEPAFESMPPAPLTPELKILKTKLRRALAIYHPKRLNTRDHNTWEVMHAIVAYGVQSEMSRGGPGGPPVSSIGWLCYNGVCKDSQLLHIENGRVAARKGVSVQGHHGQFLAILAQSRVPANYPLRVEGRSFKLTDLIESEKLGCETGMELTFKLISLAHYLDLNETWHNKTGELWSIPRLIKEEIRAPINGAACGGTHRLMGLSYAVHNRQARGEPVDGEYRRAKKYTDDYHRYTLALQNPDGSFSTEWFVKRAARPDLSRRLQTSGHTLEWLAYSLSMEELTDPRVIKAVNYLTDMLLTNRDRQWEIGPLGHALHSLVIYDYRLFQTEEKYEDRPAKEQTPAVADNAGAPRLLPPVDTTLRPALRSPAASAAISAQAVSPQASPAVTEPVVASPGPQLSAPGEAAQDPDLAAETSEPAGEAATPAVRLGKRKPAYHR
jgi:hypothetical protein